MVRVFVVTGLGLSVLGCGARTGLDLPPSGSGGSSGGTTSSVASTSASSSSSSLTGGGCAVSTTTAVRLAMSAGGIFDVAADASFAYWANPDAGTVSKVSRCDGTVTVLATEQTSPFGIAVDADAVYFTTQTANGGVHRIARRRATFFALERRPSRGHRRRRPASSPSSPPRTTAAACDRSTSKAAWRGLYAGSVARRMTVDATDPLFRLVPGAGSVPRAHRRRPDERRMRSSAKLRSSAGSRSTMRTCTLDLGHLAARLGGRLAYPGAGRARDVLASAGERPGRRRRLVGRRRRLDPRAPARQGSWAGAQRAGRGRVRDQRPRRRMSGVGRFPLGPDTRTSLV